MTADLTNIPATLERVAASTAQALADLETLTAAAGRSRRSLQDALAQAGRAAALADFDPALLQQFFDKPYCVRPLGDGQYELIVPRFIGFRAGWPVRQTKAYSVFLVSRFIHFLNPAPAWLADELGFAAPSFKAALEGDVITIAEGDVAAVAERLGGKKTIARREGNRLWLRPASRFGIIRRIIREEGFLPYTLKPVPASLQRAPQIALDENDHPAFTLRPHQARDYARFLDAGGSGAIAVFAYPQTGKSFIPLHACAELTGPKLILCPRRSLVDQWQARLALFLTPEAVGEVTVSTYQGARKHLDREWTLVVFDEAHHMPADFAIESATAIQATARIGLSATPRREDGNEDLIPALCGFPLGADWPVTEAQRPGVTVWLVKDEAAKLKQAKRLCAEPTDGKTFIFTYRLNIGEQMAKMLGVPFVQGKTKKPLSVIEDAETVVISSVGNEGLSFPVRRVVELDFLYGSAMEAGQRLGRLAYEIQGKDTRARTPVPAVRAQASAGKPGEHHVLMTPDEYHRYGKRLLIYEQWGLDVDLRAAAERGLGPARMHPAIGASRARVTRSSTRASRPASVKAKAAAPAGPDDEIARIIALPSVASRIARAQKNVDPRAAAHVLRLFRLCFSAAFSPDEIAEGLGQSGASTVARYRAACKAMARVGLLSEKGGGKFTVNRDEVNRLQALAGAVGGRR